MKKLIKAAAVVAVLFLLGACDKEPKFVKAADICNVEEGEIVITEGILALPESFHSNGEYGTLVFKSENGEKMPGFNFFYYGDMINAMGRIHNNYTEDDIKIYDFEGNIIKLGEKVRITGKKYAEKRCEISVSKIEKAG